MNKFKYSCFFQEYTNYSISKAQFYFYFSGKTAGEHLTVFYPRTPINRFDQNRKVGNTYILILILLSCDDIVIDLENNLIVSLLYGNTKKTFWSAKMH